MLGNDRWAMDLIDDVAHRLQHVWGHHVAVVNVRVHLRDRAVFDTVSLAGGSVVVKVDTAPRRLAKELLMLRAAADGGIPVPTVLLAKSSLPGFLVLTMAEGHALSAVSPRVAWADAGRHLRRLHDLARPPDIPQFNQTGGDWREFLLWWTDRATRKVTSAGVLSPNEVRRLRSQLSMAFREIADPECRLLHGDCQPDHFFSEPRTGSLTALIDFGDASIGDPAWDFAVLTLRHPQRLGAALDGYRPGSRLREHIRRWTPAYRTLRSIGVVNWLADNGLDYGEDLEFLRQRL
jgi:aminoglycoside phosphotransferase (APT) family kinase protein